MNRQSLIRTLTLAAIVVAAASLIVFGQNRPAPDPAPSETPRPYVNPTPGELPIVAGYAFNIDNQLTRRQFQLVRQAGFNIADAFYGDTIQFWKALDACKDTGVKVAVNIIPTRYARRCGPWARRLRNNPDVAYYCGRDEAPLSLFPAWRPVYDSLYKNDPNHVMIMNLLPGAVSAERLEAPDYMAYLNGFVDITNPALISFDFYPVYISKGKICVSDKFFDTVEQVYDVCRKRGRVMWGYMMSSPHRIYPTPTKAHLRFAAFSQLGYGAQGLSYFTYGYPDIKEKFSGTPIDSLGRRTKIWKTVRDVNREIRKLQHIFLGCEVIDVSHTGDKLPEGTHRPGILPKPFTQLLSGAEGVMVSHFRNGPKEYLLLVNHSVTDKQKVRLDATPGADIRRHYGNGKTRRFKSSTLTLDPGGYALFGWSAN